MGAGVARLALITAFASLALVGAAAFARTAQESSAALRARLVGVEADLRRADETTLEPLIDELALVIARLEELARNDREDQEAARGLVQAVYVAVNETRLRRALGDEPDARIEAAIAACERLSGEGGEETAARAGYAAAIWARQQNDLPETLERLDVAIERTPLAWRMRPFLLALRVDVLRTLGRFDDAENGIATTEAALKDEQGFTFHKLARRELYWSATRLYTYFGLPDVALGWFERATELARSLGDPLSIYDAAVLRANFDMDVDRPRVAERTLRALLSDASFLAGRQDLRARLRLRLGAALVRLEVEHGASANPSSDARSELATALREPTLERSERLIAHMHLLDLAVRSRQWDEAQRQLDACREQLPSADDAAAPVVESIKVAALAAMLAIDRGAPRETLAEELATLERSYDAFLDQWRTTPMRAGGVGFLGFGSRREVVGQLLRLTVRVHEGAAGVERALNQLMRAQALGTISRGLSAERGSIADVRAKLLPEGGGALVLLPGYGTMHVIALDREGAWHAEVGMRGLDDALVALDEELEREPSAASPSRAAALGAEVASRLLSAPIRARVAAWSSILVVGAELAGDPYVEALSLDGRECLGARKAIAYAPSLPLAIALADRAPPPRPLSKGCVALLAAPEASESARARWPKAEPFELAQDDLDALVAPFGADGVAVLRGRAATRAALLALDGASLGVLHVLAHGVHDPARERPAGLLLCDDDGAPGEVWCSDVDRLRAPPLVILSTCGAARGPARLGDDGLAHLGGAFLSAGASCVVLAHTRIELATTIELMRRFHARVAAGDAPAEALRAARASLGSSARVVESLHLAKLRVLGLGRAPIFAAR